MVGTFADVVVADAIVKDIQGFNLVTAFEALYKGLLCNFASYDCNATQILSPIHPDGLRGR